ncbi:hypothetical protein Tco_0805065 [Tanacetum coccineum]
MIYCAPSFIWLILLAKKTGANGTRKVGVIQEFMNDALDSALDSDDMEDEIDEELDRVLIATFDSDDRCYSRVCE